MNKELVNIDKQYFFIVDKINGEVHKINIIEGKGIIRQINEAYDNFLSGLKEKENK